MLPTSDFVLPHELFARIAGYLNYQTISQLSTSQPIRDLLESEQFWRKRSLFIACRKELLAVLNDPLTKYATIINISAAELDDTDLSFISQHFLHIRSINISQNPDLTDDGIMSLLESHGNYLERLNLSKLFRLTNVTLQMISDYCPTLHKLVLDGCMFSATGLRSIAEGIPGLRKLSISRCHIVDTKDLPAILQSLPKLKKLSMSHLDGLQPYQVESAIANCDHLQTLDIRGCPEFTLKTVRTLIAVNKKLRIDHDAQLEDHTLDSVRRFLLGLVNT